MADDTVMEEREELMVVSPSSGEVHSRKAHFLKPSATSASTAASPPPSAAATCKGLPVTVTSAAWACQQKWKTWVEKMRCSHHSTWKRAGILDAIITTTYPIRRCEDLILGLSEKWSPTTNSFVFQWGEATITLEDMMALGAYSVLGEPVFISTPPGDEEMENKVNKLIESQIEIRIPPGKKAYISKWMTKFMDSGSEIEHEAFLAYWLSKFVFPFFSKSVGRSVFPIAVHLARGTRIALAPAVLASIYRALTFLKEGDSRPVKRKRKRDRERKRKSNFVVSAPLALVQVWAWERLPLLRPNPLGVGENEPRIARWVGRVIRSSTTIDSAGEDFVWRPYTSGGVYMDDERWEAVESEEMESFVRCVRVSKLVGLEKGCIEQYLPHRVAMQFGMDQDLPGRVAQDNVDPETAWSDYIRPIGDAKIYVPPRLYQPCVTSRYLEWWKKLKGRDLGMAAAEQVQDEMDVNVEAVSEQVQDETNVDVEAVSEQVQDETNVDVEAVSLELEDETNVDVEAVLEQVQDDMNVDVEEVLQQVQDETNVDVEAVSKELEDESNVDVEVILEQVQDETNVDVEAVSELVQDETNVDVEALSEELEDEMNVDVEAVSEELEDENEMDVDYIVPQRAVIRQCSSGVNKAKSAFGGKGRFKRSKRRYLQLFRRQRNVDYKSVPQRDAQRSSAAIANGSECSKESSENSKKSSENSKQSSKISKKSLGKSFMSSKNSSEKSSEKLMLALMEASDSGRGCEIEGKHGGQGENCEFSGARNENVVELSEAMVDRVEEKIGSEKEKSLEKSSKSTKLSSETSSEKLIYAPMEESNSGSGCELKGKHEAQGENCVFSGLRNENVAQLSEATVVDRAKEKIGSEQNSENSKKSSKCSEKSSKSSEKLIPAPIKASDLSSKCSEKRSESSKKLMPAPMEASKGENGLFPGGSNENVLPLLEAGIDRGEEKIDSGGFEERVRNIEEILKLIRAGKLAVNKISLKKH